MGLRSTIIKISRHHIVARHDLKTPATQAGSFRCFVVGGCDWIVGNDRLSGESVLQ